MTSELAGNIAPAQITTCEGKTDTFVRVNLAEAIRCTRKAQYRLVCVASAATDAARQTMWDSGPEKTWFADYEFRKLDKIKNIFDRIAEILASPSLKVVCDPDFNSYAKALPGLRRIRLGRFWIDSDPEERSERIQTFIHEAAHIAGQSVAYEKPWYGKTKAKAKAIEMQATRPMMVTRSAENYGYYAMEVSDGFSVYLWS